MTRKNLNAAIWLIGLGILFLVRNIWPGILILIGLTMIVNVLIKDEAQVIPPTTVPEQRPPADVVDGVEVTPKPEKTAETMPYDPPEAGGEPLPAVLATEGERLFLASQLPDKCPACNAPMKPNAEKLKWNPDNSVECMFCGYRLTIKTE